MNLQIAGNPWSAAAKEPDDLTKHFFDFFHFRSLLFFFVCVRVSPQKVLNAL
jgi:hypothetical protein